MLMEYEAAAPSNAMLRNVNYLASLLVADKYQTKLFLAEYGYGVPGGAFFRRRKIEDADQAFDGFSGPVCVKPNNGSEGRRVFPALTERRWYEQALHQVAENLRQSL